MMNYFRQTLVSLMCLLSLLLGACASVPEELEILDTTLKNYEKSMLWSEYDYILSSHKGQKMSQYHHERLKSIKVTSYDVLKSKLLPGGKKFVQLVDINYYNRSVGRVRSIRVEQEWVYEKERNAWVVLTPFPDFK